MPAVNSITSGKTTGSQTSLTISHTVASGSDQVLYVLTYSWNTTITCTATYGGAAMSKGGSLNPNSIVRIEWFYLVNPTVGTANVVITPSSSTWISAGVYGITGVDYDAVGRNFAVAQATGGDLNPTITISSNVGDLVIDIVGNANSNVLLTPFNVGAGQTKHYGQDNQANSDLKSAGSTEAGAASVTMSWTLTAVSGANGWAIGAFSIPAAGTATTTVRVSQLVAETLATTTPDVRVSQLVVETLSATVPFGGGIRRPFFGFRGVMTGTTGQRWDPTTPHWVPSTVINNIVGIIPITGTIKNLAIRRVTAPGGATSATYTIWCGPSAGSVLSTGITVTFGSADTGIKTDITHTFEAFPGYAIYIEQTSAGGTPATTVLQGCFELESADNDAETSYHFGGGSGGSFSTVTNYDGILYGGSWTTVASQAANIVGVAGTITAMYLRRSTFVGTGTQTAVIVKNGVDQDGTGGTPDTRIAMTGSSVFNWSTTFSLPVAALDEVYVKVSASGTVAAAFVAGAVAFTATTAGQMNFGSANPDTLASASTEYLLPVGSAVNWSNVEADHEFIGPITPLELSGLYGRLSGALSAGITATFTVRLNTADTAQVIAIVNPATAAGPSAGAVVNLTNADRWSLKGANSGITTARALFSTFMLRDPDIVPPTPTDEFDALLIAP